MSALQRDPLRRLGATGVVRVLDDLLDQARLVKLANACGLRYPGMRTQSQKRERLLADLGERAGKEEATRRSILRALEKETAPALRALDALEPEQRAARLAAEPKRVPGALGVHLFLLAASMDDAADASLARLLAHEAPPAPATRELATEAEGRETTRLRKKALELQKKLLYVEGQMTKARETEKVLKREIMKGKGELAESRMLVERLRRESHGAHTVAAEAATNGNGAPADRNGSSSPMLEEVAKTARKLAQEQRKLAHAVERLASATPEPPQLPPETLAPVLEALEDLRKESASARREKKKDEQEQARVLEEVRAGLRAARIAAEEAPGSTRPTRRRKDEPERVGVFIDVQNVYYSARQLKGKLDFDALLLSVVRGRRQIVAKAYVVESKEIDQSGFIAMLQQRAIEVRRKTLKIRSDGSMKGDWDMEMALEILDAAPRLDVIVLVSGDGDFTSLVHRVKGMGPRVEVAAFPRNTAKSLLEAADEFHALDRKFMIRTTETPVAREGAHLERPRSIAAVGGGEAPPFEETGR